VTNVRQASVTEVSAVMKGQPMQAITLDLPRRGFMAGLCAATAKAALTPVGAIAGGDTTRTYPSAIEMTAPRSRFAGLIEREIAGFTPPPNL
jgi:hypothetical protein